MRWAVFKDFRGVAYCEPVNEGITVWVLDLVEVSSRKNWLGKVVVKHRPAERRIKAVFDPNLYSRNSYMDSAFAPAPSGYVFRDDIRYMKENRWGPVEVIAFIEDDKLGPRMQYELRRLAPEGELYDLGSKRNNAALPHPATDRIIEKLMGVLGTPIVRDK